MCADTVSYQYDFRLAEGTHKSFDVVLDAQTMDAVPPTRDSYPAWTELNNHQCPNCPLNAAEHPRCPIAVSLVDLTLFFKESSSYEEVDVQLETEERHYTKHTTVQRAVASILGIYMVTSGCPIMDKLRPMVRFHLPFSNAAETTYRVISMYLMAQYFRNRKGVEADWKLGGLVKLYEDIHLVNTHFLERLNQIETLDASANALIILDCFANQIQMSIGENDLGEFETLFTPYFEEQ